MPTAAKLTVAKHRNNLEALRAATETRLESLQRGYDELSDVGDDVGAGDDEGGSEGDVSVVERDRIRAQMGEEQNMLEAIDAAFERAASRGWDKCRICGEPIGSERLAALPTADTCVSCKARQAW
jgi:RNA polymerase-binding transcription factor DksA